MDRSIEIDKLIQIGLTVGENFNCRKDCIIDPSHCFLITIGNNVTFAPRVHILAHDASTKRSIGYTKIGLVNIGNNVFIGAGSIVLPNVKIGDNSIIGAGSVVSKDIPANSVAVGNPARVIMESDKYIEKNKLLLTNRPKYSSKWTINNEDFTYDMKETMKKDLESGIGFVE